MSAYEFSDAKLGIVFENAEMVRPSAPYLVWLLKLTEPFVSWISAHVDGSDASVTPFQLSLT
jgi:hypothetical protein